MAECVPTPDSPEPPSDEEYLPVGSGEEEGETGGSGVLKPTKEQSRYIKLNVGGALFTTTLGTLLKEDNMLRAMFSGRLELQTDEDGNRVCTDECCMLHSLRVGCGFFMRYFSDVLFLR